MDKDKDFLDNDDMEEDYPIITMTDDETGEDIEFMVMDAIDVEDDKYFLVIESKDIDNDDAEALLLKEDPNSKGEDVIYSIVENDIEFNSIIELLCESNDEYDLKF